MTDMRNVQAILGHTTPAMTKHYADHMTDEHFNSIREIFELCRDNIIEYVNGDDSKCAERMALASHLAGQAINISRTTASHALSYKITSDYGIPHGHAVALTIAKLFDKNTQDGSFAELKECITDKPLDYFNDLFAKIGLEYNIEKLGITDIPSIVENVNIERLSNNPVKLSKEDITSFFEGCVINV